MTGLNVFSYCGNGPTNRINQSGAYWETVFDIVSLCLSASAVANNPKDFWAWAGLMGDIIDLVPFVTGVGETIKTVGVTIKVANSVALLAG